MAPPRAHCIVAPSRRRLIRGVIVALTMLGGLSAGGAPAVAGVVASMIVAGVEGPGSDGSIAATSFEFLPPDGKSVRFIKTPDSSSSQLSQLVSGGTTVATVVMTVTWPAKSGTVVYTMSDVTFSAFLSNNGVETVTFEWSTIAQTPSRGAATVAGQVLDLCTGKSVAGAAITATPSTPGSNAVTDAKGRFKLTGFADGQYDVNVAATGYLGLARSVVIAGAKSHGPIVVGLTPLVASDSCS